MKYLLILVLAVTATACINACAPDDRFAVWGGEEIKPLPKLIKETWLETEVCSGLQGDISHITFVIADSVRDKQGHVVLATVHDDSLGYKTVAIQRFYVTSQPLIKHEILHALGIKGHPDKYFRGACGKLNFAEGD